MKVAIKDYKKQQHELKVALELCGLSTDYITADLVYSVLEALSEKGDSFSIKDGVKIQLNHEKKWEAYFKEKATKK